MSFMNLLPCLDPITEILRGDEGCAGSCMGGCKACEGCDGCKGGAQSISLDRPTEK